MDSETPQSNESVNVAEMLGEIARMDAPAEDTPGNLQEPEQAKPDETPAVEPAPEEDKLTKLEREVEDHRRLIAQNPYLSAQYQAQRYNVPVEQILPPQTYTANNPPPQAQPPATESPMSVADLFSDSEDGFDPYNPEHQLRLQQFAVQQQLEQKLQPFTQYIQSQQQYEMQQLAQQHEQVIHQADKQMVEVLGEVLPGVSDLMSKTNLSPSEQQVAQILESAIYDTTVAMFPPTQQLADGRMFNPLWLNPQAQKDIIANMAPIVNEVKQRYGDVLGIKPTSNPQAAQVIGRDMAFESSNAVTSGDAQAFDSAVKSGNVVNMMLELSRL